ncbi:recQ-mediated genome instability protein 2 [Macaca thibetana thibetana]|uniref:RecQ-mediated genome instability protein 2 n=1 Tax=Macaca mulatta TaxID=9544 RepID=A0A5F8AHU3_MACMU|nr:recQ-mediated genome instability protein 2 [Macaca mulatta]XP_014981082.2 recQ-mediated genome instability protein 2 isoform X1 [Macaca mulatta]XP_045238192.1 recQ-mediated genome instability protein 2 [Macaca fascicularis]XP_050617724.1 recQ-mediated genome instability protein 2 [Macaca thibetana thibetana]XP_050630578.1 recQ-mediated genome instability protein 2 [Macaca thibetana thibetana]
MAAAADSFSAGPAGVRLPRSPPLKVLAEQLRRDAEGGPGAWRLSRAAAGRGPLDLAAVWMQGRVVMADRGEARLRDPSGGFSVRGLERVPRGRPCLVPGKYVMVMGVVQACSPEPCLQAVKMTDLSDNPIHESMWELEVEDLHKNIP